jgi:hypothetical protein
MTLHKKSGSGLNSACLIAPGPQVSSNSLFYSMALETACAFTLSEHFRNLASLPSSSIELHLRVSQVGFRKRTRQLFGLHTQLELILAGVSLLLATLLLGCLLALGVQYYRGRWAHTFHLSLYLWGL